MAWIIAPEGDDQDSTALRLHEDRREREHMATLSPIFPELGPQPARPKEPVLKLHNSGPNQDRNRDARRQDDGDQARQEA